MSQPFDFAELVEEASERAGGEGTTAADVHSLRRSLYLIQQDWMQKNYPTWRVEFMDIHLTGTTAEIQLPEYVDDVIQVNSLTDSHIHEQPMRRIPPDQYAMITDKLTTGRPAQYFLKRSEPPVLHVYPVGTTTTVTGLRIMYIKRPDEFERYSNESDIPGRWARALVQALALELAKKRPPYSEDLISRLEREALQAEGLAARDDRDRSNYRVRI